MLWTEKMKILISVLCMFAFLAVANEKVENVKEKVGEAGHAISDYAYSQKEEYIAKTKEEVNHLKKDLADLEIKAKRATGTAKKEAKEKIQTVKSSIRKLNDEVDELKSTTEADWNEVKSKYTESISKIKDAIEKSREWLSEKIAPDKKMEN